MDHLAVAKKAWTHLIDRYPNSPRRAGDDQGFYDCVTDDVELSFSFPRDTPIYGEGFHGKQDIVDLTSTERELIETGGVECTPEFIVGEDQVVLLAEQTYTVKKTGLRVSGHMVAIVMNFREGLISRIRIYEDGSGYLETLKGTVIRRERAAAASRLVDGIRE